MKAARASAAHPNDLDRRRIERALSGRKRYRYVSPEVRIVDDGYLVRSPCCSRNIDPEGGVIDIALLICRSGKAPWRLYSREDATDQWALRGSFAGLGDLLEHLSSDTERVFWR